ncbi:CatA-like O-acetyltransferase [Clostridium sp. Marseille-P2415]|uniref:CatA-like O-acetyltransferase n=1 Tax=Clostridium sp. Marseille-P2415 TaxID=1805471 RepID=UPI0009885D5D|nr:CatA-like O-acetyltransferase [Clostridium sp. Marseille-P2415]
MSYHELDMEHYLRKGQFDLFRNFAYPYVGMTVNLDITYLMKCIKEKGLSFYLTFLYAAAGSANAIPEFRHRLHEDRIIEYDHCIPSYTLALENESYCYCTADDRLPFPDYLTDAKLKQEEAKRAQTITDGGNEDQLFFFSSIPWTSYTAIIQPVPMPADSNPRITWGKYFESEGCLKIPVSVLANHALMDGYHISKFFTGLQNRCDQADWLTQDF